MVYIVQVTGNVAYYHLLSFLVTFVFERFVQLFYYDVFFKEFDSKTQKMSIY